MPLSDPLGLLALARAQTLSEDVEEQLTARARDGYRPLIATPRFCPHRRSKMKRRSSVI